jgi:predicted NUDIX family NTP pyrophosphohydrolase
VESERRPAGSWAVAEMAMAHSAATLKTIRMFMRELIAIQRVRRKISRVFAILHWMSKRSAGLVPYRRTAAGLEVLLVHPGGPFWEKKDAGAWSVCKGEFGDQEDPLAAARREFREETGFDAEGDFIPLGTITQKGGKTVFAWAIAFDCDVSAVRSNTFEMEWPPKSGKMKEFPEIDRAGWFSIDAAREKLLPSQAPFLDRLSDLIR